MYALSTAPRPGLQDKDAQGFPADLGGTDLETASTGEAHHRSAASLVLFGKDKEVLSCAP